MAQRAESLNAEPMRPRITPVPPLQIVKPQRQKPLAQVKSVTTRAYRSTKARVRDAYSRVINKSSVLSNNVQGKLQRARQERPMQIVAAVAVTGFVVGVVLRVWRSKYNA